MDLKRITKDTAKTLTSYITYQAVRVVMGQLRETDVPRSYWFNEFATRDKLQDGEKFLTDLMQEQADLALRVMIVRQHIAEEINEYLPEMLLTGIQQANIEHRKRHLERITQMSSDQLSGTDTGDTGSPD